MKKIKMKDIILSHYQKVHELAMDGLTVRVWKPRTMQKLPAYKMLEWIRDKASDAIRYMTEEQKSCWAKGNPDYGMWDALAVYHLDPHHKVFDMYVSAILVRPFSWVAYDWYCRKHENIDEVDQRLILMWDSREFDRINGYDTSYGAYENQEEADAAMYSVTDKESDILDETPSSYLQVIDEEDDTCPVRRCGLTLRQQPDGGTEYHAIINGHEETERGGTELMHAAAKCYNDFRKEHPEVTEMRFYTDELVVMEEGDE